MQDKNKVAHGPRAVSASPAAQIPTKRLMLLIEARARDSHLNKAVRHLRLESSHHDVLVRPSHILAWTVLRWWLHSTSLNQYQRHISFLSFGSARCAASSLGTLLQVHELRKEGDAERLVRAAFDAATLNPAEKTIHTFVAVGGDDTANAGALSRTSIGCLLCTSQHGGTQWRPERCPLLHDAFGVWLHMTCKPSRPI